MQIRLLAGMAVALLDAANEPKNDAVKAEMKKLEGTRSGVSAVADGKKVPDNQAKAVSYT